MTCSYVTKFSNLTETKVIVYFPEIISLTQFSIMTFYSLIPTLATILLFFELLVTFCRNFFYAQYFFISQETFQESLKWYAMFGYFVQINYNILYCSHILLFLFISIQILQASIIFLFGSIFILPFSWKMTLARYWTCLL